MTQSVLEDALEVIFSWSYTWFVIIVMINNLLMGILIDDFGGTEEQ
eukprot:gene30968-38826_t